VPTLDEVAHGVFAWLQPGGESGVSNAGVVVDDDGVTVIDTLMVPSQWEPFADAVKGLGVPIRRIVLTHAHIGRLRDQADQRGARPADADLRLQGVHACIRR
jgi:cyclase